VNRIQLLAPYARRQHGLVTLDQAVETGMSRSTWYRCLADGRLEQRHPRVARLPGTADTTFQRIAAAVLGVGPGAQSSHTTGAFLLIGDLPGLDPVDPVHVIAPRPCQLKLERVMVHRPTDRADLTATTRHGIATTRPLRTIVDAGAVVSLSQLGSIVDRALVLGLITFDAIGTTVQRHGRQGRDGVGPLRRLLDDWHLGAEPPDSVLEVEFGRLLAAHGLPAATFHPRVRAGDRDVVPDFGYLLERVLIEVDGWAFHGDRAAFEQDRRRDALLQAEGWAVLRFTWYQVHHEPRWVAAQIRAVLTARSAA
jgi:very-short-patch-repair endonuclease